MGGETMTIRILLVDDHQMFRESLEVLIRGCPGFEVAGGTGDGLDAVRLAGELAPDVVLMDVSLPGLNGIDATRRILAANARVRVIGLSMHVERRFESEMRAAGATGYLSKDCSFTELAEAIRAAAAGAPVAPVRAVETVRRLPKLSGREREVLQLLAEGRNVKEIAHSLGLSAKTVETHRAHVMDKLGMHSIADLTRYAIREGLTPLGR